MACNAMRRLVAYGTHSDVVLNPVDRIRDPEGVLSCEQRSILPTEITTSLCRGSVELDLPASHRLSPDHQIEEDAKYEMIGADS